MSWTDERVELLKLLYADGLSASQIAGQLGGITRNAVIGKATRLGLKPRGKRPATPRIYKPRVARSTPIQTLPVLTPEDVARQQQVIAETKEAADLPPDVSNCAVSLVDLNDNTCRWPLGDPQQPGFMFCGAMPIKTSPYCLRHAALAYTPVPRRREKPRPWKKAA